MSKADEAKKTIKIQNVVASTAIGQEIDLKSLTLSMEGQDYDPEQFPGLVYRTKDPKAALLFSGAERSSAPVRRASRRSALPLKKYSRRWKVSVSR